MEIFERIVIKIVLIAIMIQQWSILAKLEEIELIIVALAK
jgi:hypothetical protein